MELQEALEKIEQLSKEKLEVETKYQSLEQQLNAIKDNEFNRELDNLGVIKDEDMRSLLKTKAPTIDAVKEYIAKKPIYVERKIDIDKVDVSKNVNKDTKPISSNNNLSKICLFK